MLDPPTHINFMQTVGRFDIWVTAKTNRPNFWLILNLSRALDGLFSPLSRLHCMVVNIIINAFFAEWRITARDYFQILLLGILSGMEPTRHLFSDSVAATATFRLSIVFWMVANTYFCHFRLALLNLLRALVHLIYLLIFNNFLVFNPG